MLNTVEKEKERPKRLHKQTSQAIIFQLKIRLTFYSLVILATKKSYLI